jgi:hypothetical protein
MLILGSALGSCAIILGSGLAAGFGSIFTAGLASAGLSATFFGAGFFTAGFATAFAFAACTFAVFLTVTLSLSGFSFFAAGFAFFVSLFAFTIPCLSMIFILTASLLPG